MVEPLGRARVADGAAVLNPVVGIQQLGADDPDVGTAVRRVLKARQPVAQRDDVGVEQHDVIARVGRPQPAVDVGREAGVVLALNQLDPVDVAQRGEVLRAAGVVGSR